MARGLKQAAVAIATLMLVTGGAAHSQGRENQGRDIMLSMGGGMKGKALERAIEKAEQHPLGSRENPVRENMPGGERAYLGRLRCKDGAAPAFDRGSSMDEEPFGFIVHLYKVTCAGESPVNVYMDMYHDGPEKRPVPGFTIVDP